MNVIGQTEPSSSRAIPYRDTPRRNLIVCCDGTANAPTKARTNVMRLWLAIERSPDQVLYYDPGVGTLGNPDALTGLRKRISRGLDSMMGRGLRHNVIEAYEFLMDFYEPSDRIFLFGFSRGAYTVRALAGMMFMYGLLPRGSRNFVPYIWSMYSNDDRETTKIGKRIRIANELKRLNRQVPIEFVGVWDTVSSWGLFFNFRSLPWTAKLPHVLHIRHAVALDERRAAFRANLFDVDDNLDLQELGFTGVHSDVGGGYAEEENGLAKISLVWIMDEAARFGLRFDAALKTKLLGLANRPGRTQYSSADPKALIHQSLRGAWWLMEYVPRRLWHATDQRYKWRCNRGAHRWLPDDRVPRHFSVAARSTRDDGGIL
jgi:uncharacterized protein (DUF2235 family)